jgi:hypothetical protein
MYDQHLQHVFKGNNYYGDKAEEKDGVSFMHTGKHSGGLRGDVCRTSCIDITSRKQTDSALLDALAVSVQRHAEISHCWKGQCRPEIS